MQELTPLEGEGAFYQRESQLGEGSPRQQQVPHRLRVHYQPRIRRPDRERQALGWPCKWHPMEDWVATKKNNAVFVGK